MSGKWFGPNLRPLIVLGAAIAVTLAPALARHKKADPYTQYRNNPHSSGWLNREIARHLRTDVLVSQRQRHHRPPRIALPPVNDPAQDITAQDTQATTTIVDLNGGKLVAAWEDSNASAGSHLTGYAFSSNKGITWTDAGTLPPGPHGDAGEPVLANDPSANVVYLATLSFAGPPLPIQIFKSSDQGHTWGAPSSAGGTSPDKPWLAVDRFAGTGQHNLYACYTEFGISPAAISVTRSSDFSATFSSPVVVSNTGASQGCFLTVSPNHQVNVYYFRTSTGPSNDIWTRHSTDQGATWSPEVLVAHLQSLTTNGDIGLLGFARTNSFPHAVVIPDVLKPYQYVVFNDFDPSAPGSKSDVWVVRSVDNGASWSPRQRINDDPIGDQWMPTIAVTPTDQLMFGYYSRSNDSANLLFHRRGRLGIVNPDKTTTLYHSFQLGPDNPIAIAQDPAVIGNFMGDYDQIAAAGSVFSTVWSDNRSADALHTNQPDVHFAQIAAVPSNTDLSVTATGPASTSLGGNVTFTVTATATGGAANDVYLSMRTVSPGFVFQTILGSGCERPTGTFAGCSLGPIAAGTSKTVQVLATAVDGTGSRTFAATGTTSSNDTNTANNTGSTTVSVGLGSAVTGVYSTGNVAIPLPDATTTIIPIAVPDQGVAVKVIARVRLNHTFDSDLRLTLISPNGKSTVLSNRRGGGSDDYGSGNTDCTGTFTVFDDLAPTSIANGVAPFAGTFAPEELLSKTLLDPMDGSWKLKIEDLAAADSGTLYCARLDITHLP